jgi:hypothetical protein
MIQRFKINNKYCIGDPVQLYREERKRGRI